MKLILALALAFLLADVLGAATVAPLIHKAGSLFETIARAMP